MNLHGIVAPIIGIVNPNVGVTIRVNTGYTVNSDGSTVPNFTDIQAVAQIQALTYQDMQFLDGLTINGERRAIYLYGKFDSVDRPAATGGDLIIFGDSTEWLVAYVLETWPDWCKVAATRQNV